MYKGKLISADFEESTMEFEIAHEFTIKSGEYVILSKEDYESLVKESDDLPCVSNCANGTPYYGQEGECIGKRCDECGEEMDCC